MRQELADGVTFISAAHRMRGRFGPQTTRRQQIQALDTMRFAVGLDVGPIRRQLSHVLATSRRGGLVMATSAFALRLTQ